MDKISFLRKLDLFKDLSVNDLQLLCNLSQEVKIAAGDYLLREGDPGGALYIILQGEYEVIKRSGNSQMVLALRGPSEVIGEMSIIDQAPRSASVRALTPTTALMISSDMVNQLISASPAATMAIFQIMSSRMRSNEALLVQSEKMAGLGTLVAGITHELNNPAAAIQSGAAQLRKALAQTSISKHNDIYQIADDIYEASTRIAEIVGAVKTYSYLDQAPIQQVDIHKGLDNTLVILKHKLKQGIAVQKYYDPQLPLIEARGSELNQVWTNIIDNAIAALQPQLTQGQEAILTIRTSTDDKHIKVEISDNGPGMTEEIKGRIFEPFFTTKSQGEGTGLGLHICYNIITVKHHGQIQVRTQTTPPSGTTFNITLPIVYIGS